LVAEPRQLLRDRLSQALSTIMGVLRQNFGSSVCAFVLGVALS
jgi:hypothetical protein